ncbi:MAG: HAD family hydrolase [Archaeoglobaceae archaeon]
MPEANGSGLRAIVFDMDNTLFDFVEAKLKACNAVVERMGAGDGEELVRYFFSSEHGVEDWKNIADYMGKYGVDLEMYEECCRVYDEMKLRHIDPYPGVRETLLKLKEKGLKLTVVTDALNGHAMDRLRKCGLLEYFDVVVTGDMTGRKKPEPDSIELALERLQVGAEEAILVGDSLKRDIEAGRSLGMFTVYAAYGDRNYFDGRVNQADFVLTEFGELLDLVWSDSLKNLQKSDCSEF